MNASIAIQVLPTVPENEIIRVVDAVIAYIRSTGYRYAVGPFETTVEGDYDGLMEIVRRAQLICVENGASGAMTYVKINYKPEGVWTIDQKISKHQ